MAHGGGGRLMKRLLDDLIIPTLDAETADAMHDAVRLEQQGDNVITAFTTDSYVVKPLEFPGGDIGCLSVYGTVNDLAMSGARPAYLSVGLIIEEGMDMTLLHRLLLSMREAADETGIRIVTGDTKVVDHGKGDGLYINTAGIGYVSKTINIHPRRILPGDCVILSGDLGRHGIAIMAEREGLTFNTAIKSDCASLSEAVQDLIKVGIDIHCLRDITRGGLASVLNELAQAAAVGIELEEEAISIGKEVKAACELLGLDPLYVACEGRMIVVVAASDVNKTLQCLAGNKQTTDPVVIGRVDELGKPGVTLLNAFGAARVLNLLSGEQLPRIC
jgi:hydrogenase expression/formation protein HypE